MLAERAENGLVYLSTFFNVNDASNVTDLSVKDFSFDQLGIEKVIAFIVVFAGGSLAAAAGAGGGAIYIPLFIILFGFLYEAVPLSKAAVFGAALAFFILNLLEPNPTKLTKHPNRFAYDVVMLMEPATLIGTSFGVLGTRVTPIWLITIVMVALMGSFAAVAFEKGRKLRMKETVAQLSGIEAGGNESLKRSLIDSSHEEGGYGTGNDFTITRIPDTYTDDSRVEGPWLGWRCMCTVGICFVTVLVTTFMENNKEVGQELGITCNSLGFWGLLMISCFVCVSISLINVSYLIRNRDVLDGQCMIKWEPRNALYYGSLCFFAGFMSALCGIGGSTIKGPILLQMNLSPTLAKSTSQLMLLSTSLASALQFYYSGEMPPIYGLIFFMVGLMSALNGKWSVDSYVLRHGGRQSTIAYLLAYYIVTATVIMTTISVLIVGAQVYPTVNYSLLWFRGLCDPMPKSMEALRWLTEIFNF